MYIHARSADPQSGGCSPTNVCERTSFDARSSRAEEVTFSRAGKERTNAPFASSRTVYHVAYPLGFVTRQTFGNVGAANRKRRDIQLSQDGRARICDSGLVAAAMRDANADNALVDRASIDAHTKIEEITLFPRITRRSKSRICWSSMSRIRTSRRDELRESDRPRRRRCINRRIHRSTAIETWIDRAREDVERSPIERFV